MRNIDSYVRAKDYARKIAKGVKNIGRDMYNSGTRGLAAFALGASLAFGAGYIAGCSPKEDSHIKTQEPYVPYVPPNDNYGEPKTSEQGYTLGNFGLVVIGEGYEKPQGLSYNRINPTNTNGTSGLSLTEPEVISSLEMMAFAESPVFAEDGSGGYLVHPKIYQNSQSGIQEMCDLSDKFDKSHFITGHAAPISINGQEGSRPLGVILTTVQLNDGSVLFTTNLYGGIDRFYKDDLGVCQRESFIINSELIGTTGTYLSEDGGKLDIGQTIIRDGAGNGIRPKRVKTIDLLTRTLENKVVELPDGFIDESLIINLVTSQNPLDERIMPLGSLVKTIGNPQYSITNQGYVKYALDVFNGIYGITPENNPVLIVNSNNVRFPIANVAVDDGKLYGITSPLYPENASTLAFSPELVEVNPSTGEVSVPVYTFNPDSVSDYMTGGGIIVTFNGQKYLFPLGFNISLVKAEDSTKMQFFFTNTNTEDLTILEAIKDYAPTITASVNAGGTEVTATVSDPEDNINQCDISVNGAAAELFACVNGVETTVPVTSQVGDNNVQIRADNLLSDGTIGNQSVLDIPYTVQ